MSWSTTITWDIPILKWASMNWPWVHSKKSLIDKNTILAVKFVMPLFAWEMLSLP